jgi:hypothetical protein
MNYPEINEDELLPYSSFEDINKVLNLNEFLNPNSVNIYKYLLGFLQNIPDIKFRYINRPHNIQGYQHDSSRNWSMLYNSCSIEIFTNYNFYIIIHDKYFASTLFGDGGYNHNNNNNLQYDSLGNLKMPHINGKYLNKQLTNELTEGGRIIEAPDIKALSVMYMKNGSLYKLIDDELFQNLRYNYQAQCQYQQYNDPDRVSKLLKLFNDIELIKGILPIVYADYLKSLVYSNEYNKLENYFIQTDNYVLEQNKSQINSLLQEKQELIEITENIYTVNDELINDKKDLEESINTSDHQIEYMLENYNKFGVNFNKIIKDNYINCINNNLLEKCQEEFINNLDDSSNFTEYLNRIILYEFDEDDIKYNGVLLQYLNITLDSNINKQLIQQKENNYLKTENERLLEKTTNLEEKTNYLENELLKFMKENKQLKMRLEVNTDLLEKLQMKEEIIY